MRVIFYLQVQKLTDPDYSLMTNDSGLETSLNLSWSQAAAAAATPTPQPRYRYLSTHHWADEPSS